MSAKKAATITETKEVTKDQFAAKKIGANMVAKLGDEKYSRKVTMEEGEKIFKEIKIYNKKPSEERKQKIIKLLTPEATKVKEAKEKQDSKIKGVNQQLKKKDKADIQEIAKAKGEVQKEVAKSKSEGIDMLAYTKKGVAMKGFENITMPKLLVDKITTFLKNNISIKPLINFWLLCLKNPNEVARTRLFEYLSHHRFIITPSGYFVTYRLVKSTNTKGVFTDARTSTFKIKIGEVVTMPRNECDEDGANNCSKGLHVGSPSFIGVEKGEGYNKEKGQIGTGYVTQPHGQGDQAIIAFVNPANVVSIPNSDTRKLRCCEYYPFKTTTAEEIISVEDSDYYIYEADYKKIELEQLMSSIDKSSLKEYFMSKGGDKEKLERLRDKLNANIAKASEGNVAKSLTMDEIKEIVSSRLTVLNEKRPSGIQL